MCQRAKRATQCALVCFALTAARTRWTKLVEGVGTDDTRTDWWVHPTYRNWKVRETTPRLPYCVQGLIGQLSLDDDRTFQ